MGGCEEYTGICFIGGSGGCGGCRIGLCEFFFSYFLFKDVRMGEVENRGTL